MSSDGEKNGDAQRFEGITMTGRMCYIFMCIERFLLHLNPERDWKPVSERMWGWTRYPCWNDDGWYEFGAVKPANILKCKSIEDMDCVYSPLITQEEFDRVVALYHGLSTNDIDDINEVFSIPLTMCNYCDGADFDIEEGREITMDSIVSIERILQTHSIPLPNISLLSDLTPQNAKGCEWGFGVDTGYLSIILNH